jgi:hypothetical protein
VTSNQSDWAIAAETRASGARSFQRMALSSDGDGPRWDPNVYQALDYISGGPRDGHHIYNAVTWNLEAGMNVDMDMMGQNGAA